MIHVDGFFFTERQRAKTSSVSASRLSRPLRHGQGSAKVRDECGERAGGLAGTHRAEWRSRRRDWTACCCCSTPGSLFLIFYILSSSTIAKTVYIRSSCTIAKTRTYAPAPPPPPPPYTRTNTGQQQQPGERQQRKLASFPSRLNNRN